MSRNKKLAGIVAIVTFTMSGLLSACALTEPAPPEPPPLGELIPPLTVTFPNGPEWIEFWRTETQHFADIGLELDLHPEEFGTAISQQYDLHDYGHLMSISWSGREERIDPHFFLFEMLHSSRAEPGGLNAENYKNPEYDTIVEHQAREVDPDKRQELIWKSQEMISEDHPLYILVFQDNIQAYNSRDWEGLVERMGAGIAGTASIWTYVNIEPLTDQKELRVGWMSEPVTLNPLAHKGTVEHMAMLRFVYDTYVKLSPDLEVVPWAAESWNWVDDTTLDIVLRDGMQFHDGEPVTVEDVKFTFDYIEEWDLAIWKQVTDHIDSVEIIDERTVRFVLPEPFTPFLQNVLTYAIILPKHVWEGVPESVGVDSPDNWEPNEMGIGSGPFKYGYWTRGQDVFLEANNDHWNAPKIAGVHFLTVPSKEGLLGKLEAEELDIVNQSLSVADEELLEPFDFITVVRTPNHGFYMANPDLRKKPFDDVEFRRAINHIMDRRMLLEDVFGSGTLAYGSNPITPASKAWFSPNVESIDFSLDKAKQILQEAGYGWDEEGRLHYPAE